MVVTSEIFDQRPGSPGPTAAAFWVAFWATFQACSCRMSFGNFFGTETSFFIGSPWLHKRSLLPPKIHYSYISLLLHGHVGFPLYQVPILCIVIPRDDDVVRSYSVPLPLLRLSCIRQDHYLQPSLYIPSVLLSPAMILTRPRPLGGFKHSH